MVQLQDTLREWQESAAYWAKYGATIRQMFAPLTRVLIEDAQIRKGQTVLDVAGGTGEPSLTIAETVGPNGLVTCTDAIAEMVEAAKGEARAQGLANMRFHQCTAESLPFADSQFDRVVSRLGAMFFPHEAFREILRTTKPRGIIAFAVWHQSELNPFCWVVTDVLARHVEAGPADPNAPGAFRYAEIGKLAGVLKEAGVAETTERVFKFDIAAPISLEEFWILRSEISETLRAKLKLLSESERTAVAAEVKEAVKKFFPNNQMKFPAQMLIVTGKKPS